MLLIRVQIMDDPAVRLARSKNARYRPVGCGSKIARYCLRSQGINATLGPVPDMVTSIQGFVEGGH